MGLIMRYVLQIFPEVNKQLAFWENKCLDIEDDVLQKLALASIRDKKFHCQGGSIYALYPGTPWKDVVKFIVAFQTISDYLDNLCDRAGVSDELAFRQLHLALSDAVEIENTTHNYYKYYPYKADGNYLQSLVQTCQKAMGILKSYEAVIQLMRQQITLYTSLQSLKHLAHPVREEYLKNWASTAGSSIPEIFWWEFSAASGSTLLIFLCFVIAYNSHFNDNELVIMQKAYFPWVCGLHILLDYFIDYQEDLLSNDLNFVAFYNNEEQCATRIMLFLYKSIQSCSLLKDQNFHLTILNGLLAMYLSDDKAINTYNKEISKLILQQSNNQARSLYRYCRLLRFFGVI